MRLVFILYAEDRGLLPSSGEARAREIYERNYSLRGLYGRLAEDASLHPDTMDERRGAWGQLVALFRLVHGGYPDFVRRRGGKLFDPAVYPFLEGSAEVGAPARVLPVSDGCVLRVLEGLMTLKSRGGARERLSYRTLDVEQIGSVYETVMGFTVLPASGPALAVKGGKNNRTPIYLDLAEIAGLKGEERLKRIKEAGRASLTAAQSKAVKTATSIADLAAALDGIVDERACPGRAMQAAGTPVLQPTDERRRTGSHYTPRSLTEPIVRHALEPTFDRLGEAATPEQILDLRVCDPAMGSGAFLVEACRQLGNRLVQAWAHHRATPVLPPDEDADLHARRLVAQRCLYGVDKNPRAVDLAKLSLWLATLAADHEFTFLDHALREGDSLIGLTRTQIAALHWDESKPPTLVGHLVADHLREAEVERAAIRGQAETAGEAELNPRLLRAEAQLAVARLIGDGVIAVHFCADKPKARLGALVGLQKAVQSHLGSPTWQQAVAPFSDALVGRECRLRPFHWSIEFPEVFSRNDAGFDAVIGNPPFLGGNKISASLGVSYLAWLQCANNGVDGNSDLCSYFFRRAYDILKNSGTIGFIATNTISQGDTRKAGLGFIIKNGGIIYRALKRCPWPGDASVVVSVVHVCREQGSIKSERFLDGKEVPVISPFLLPADISEDPARLASNTSTCFKGVSIVGDGFIVEEDEAGDLISDNEDNAEILRPYLGGKDINGHPRSKYTRFVISFGSRSLAEARQWPALIKIVEERVKPERDKRANNAIAIRQQKYWWKFRSDTPVLRSRLSDKDFCITISEVCPHLSFSIQDVNQIFANTLLVFSIDEMHKFSVMQSRVHEIWARLMGSSMKDDLRYISSACFETFPFFGGASNKAAVEAAGMNYSDHRAAMMVARDEGMTKIYNRFHDRCELSKDIQRLRELHAEMDRAVLAAYGWDDLAARAEAQWLDDENEPEHTYQGRLFWSSAFRDEVLGRLLALNAERAAAERAAGLVAASLDEADDEAA